jgi:ABC-type transport system involved in Fe-S cluster assembly fused permease/ATPase subunit
MKAIRRGARAFGSFWWDFLVGDTPELFVAVVAVVGLALLLRRHHDIAIVLLPVITVLFLVASTWRGRQRREDQP